MIINQNEKNFFAKRHTSSGMSQTSDLSDRASLIPGLSAQHSIKIAEQPLIIQNCAWPDIYKALLKAKLNLTQEPIINTPKKTSHTPSFQSIKKSFNWKSKAVSFKMYKVPQPSSTIVRRQSCQGSYFGHTNQKIKNIDNLYPAFQTAYRIQHRKSVESREKGVRKHKRNHLHKTMILLKDTVKRRVKSETFPQTFLLVHPQGISQTERGIYSQSHKFKLHKQTLVKLNQIITSKLQFVRRRKRKIRALRVTKNSIQIKSELQQLLKSPQQQQQAPSSTPLLNLDQENLIIEQLSLDSHKEKSKKSVEPALLKSYKIKPSHLSLYIENFQPKNSKNSSAPTTPFKNNLPFPLRRVESQHDSSKIDEPDRFFYLRSSLNVHKTKSQPTSISRTKLSLTSPYCSMIKQQTPGPLPKLIVIQKFNTEQNKQLFTSQVKRRLLKQITAKRQIINNSIGTLLK